MKYEFKEGFMWGAASSGPQSEGTVTGDGRVPTEWDYWYAKEPERFFEGIGPSVTSDFYRNYKEMIRLMKEAGVKSYRTSIQWSRIYRDCEGTLNEEGVAFYHRVLDELEAQGIEPVMCLFHFDMPMYWMEKGGFENRDTAVAYSRFAAECFNQFGSRVKRWLTFNEPIIIPEMGYLYQTHYPCVCDAKKAAVVGAHIQLASSMAVAEYRRSGLDGQIGIVLNLTPAYCQYPDSPDDQKAARIVELIFNRSFLEPSVNGTFPQELIDLLDEEGILPTLDHEDLELIKENTVDFLGINYYHPRRVTTRTTPYEGPLMPEKYYEPYVFEGQRMNTSRGWEIYEKAVYDIAMEIRDHYHNIPWYLSENGMGIQGEEAYLDENGIVQDDYRIEFIKDHLAWLWKAMEEGANCFGYHLWAPFDCWSWTNAYKNRYGLIRVDVKQGGALSLKKSAGWFAKLAEDNGFEA